MPRKASGGRSSRRPICRRRCTRWLRNAFDRTMQDPEFVADAKKLGFDPRPENGDYLAALIKRMAATPKPIKDKVVELT